MKRLAATLLGTVVLVSACGSVLPKPAPVQPREVRVQAIDRDTQQPVPGAQLSVGSVGALTATNGTATVTALPGARVTARADGFDPGNGQVPANGDLTITLRSNVVYGTIRGDGGEPLPGVRVFVDGSATLVRSDALGRYRLAGVPERGNLIYKLPGHRLGVIPIGRQMHKDVTLPAFQARALYAPSAVFEGAGRLGAELALIDRTEANAMVIDVKETDGNLYWSTDLPAAKAVAAVMHHPLFELQQLLPKLKARGIYTIARMVVLKDNTLGTARPDLAVMNSVTGKPWRDFGGGIWLDPFNPGVAEYIAALAGDLADKGFDEVQLDYVRFYSDGDFSTSDTNLPNTESFRLPAIRRLFRVVSDELQTKRAFFGADVFPISFIASDDQGIGQRPEVIMPYVDYFDPLVYPSHYYAGSFGWDVPNNHPYAVINSTLKLMNAERVGLPLVIRPWIQDFGYGDFPPYTAAQVQAEMQALRDNGAQGWMIWNAGARFTAAALGAPRKGEAAAPVTSADAASAASPSATTAP